MVHAYFVDNPRKSVNGLHGGNKVHPGQKSQCPTKFFSFFVIGGTNTCQGMPRLELPTL